MPPFLSSWCCRAAAKARPPELLLTECLEQLSALLAALQAPGEKGPEGAQLLWELRGLLREVHSAVEAAVGNGQRDTVFCTAEASSADDPSLPTPRLPLQRRVFKLRRRVRPRVPRLRRGSLGRLAGCDRGFGSCSGGEAPGARRYHNVVDTSNAGDAWRCDDAMEGYGPVCSFGMPWDSAPGLPPPTREPTGIAAEDATTEEVTERARQVALMRRQLVALSSGGRCLESIPAPSMQAREDTNQSGGSFRDALFSTCTSERVPASSSQAIGAQEPRRRLPDAPALAAEAQQAPVGMLPVLQQQGLGALPPARRADDDDHEEVCEFYECRHTRDGRVTWAPPDHGAGLASRQDRSSGRWRQSSSLPPRLNQGRRLAADG